LQLSKEILWCQRSPYSLFIVFDNIVPLDKKIDILCNRPHEFSDIADKTLFIPKSKRGKHQYHCCKVLKHITSNRFWTISFLLNSMWQMLYKSFNTSEQKINHNMLAQLACIYLECVAFLICKKVNISHWILKPNLT
jgi:hypothetical protein